MAIDITPRDPWGSLFKFAALEQQAAELSFAKKQWMAKEGRETDNPEMYEAATGWKVPSQVNPFYSSNVADLQNKTVDKNAIVSSNMGKLATAADNYYRETPKAKGQKRFMINRNGKERIETVYAGNGLPVNPNESNLDLMYKVSSLTGMKPGDPGWDMAVSFVANKQKWATEKMVKDTESTIATEQAAADRYNKQIEQEKKYRGNRYLSSKNGGSAGYGVDANSIIESFNYMIQNHASTPQDVMKFYNMATEGLKSAGVTWKRPEDNPLGPPSRYMNFGGGSGGMVKYTATFGGKGGETFTFFSSDDPQSAAFKKKMHDTAKNLFPKKDPNTLTNIGPAGKTEGAGLTQAKIAGEIERDLKTYQAALDKEVNSRWGPGSEGRAKEAAKNEQNKMDTGYVVIQDPTTKKYYVKYTGTYESSVAQE